VGVQARLGNHLREMIGLSIRATVSQPDCATCPHRLSHVAGLFTYCPASAVRSSLNVRVRMIKRSAVTVLPVRSYLSKIRSRQINV
jgi:hypothetical protein